ncbi:non-specific serine/threonine protein kinase [Balamuthia mandrillaris]
MAYIIRVWNSQRLNGEHMHGAQVRTRLFDRLNEQELLSSQDAATLPRPPALYTSFQQNVQPDHAFSVCGFPSQCDVCSLLGENRLPSFGGLKCLLPFLVVEAKWQANKADMNKLLLEMLTIQRYKEILRLLAFASGLEASAWKMDMYSLGFYWRNDCLELWTICTCSSTPTTLNTCPICRENIGQQQRLTHCTECEAPFHQDCVLNMLKEEEPKHPSWYYGNWCKEDCFERKNRNYRAKQELVLQLQNEKELEMAFALVEWLAKERMKMRTFLLDVWKVLGQPLFPFGHEGKNVNGVQEREEAQKRGKKHKKPKHNAAAAEEEWVAVAEMKILCKGRCDKPLSLVSIQQPNGTPLLAVHKAYHPTEATALTKVRGHHHVVKLIQASDEGLLLEYVETGKRGDRWIPSSIAELVNALFQLTMAVVHCHKNHIIHADIKPSNVLVKKRSNRVVLIDFNCAIIFEAKPMGVGPIESGTRGWGSPEFEAGNSEECGITVDSWGIGVMAFFWLTQGGRFKDSSQGVKAWLQPDPQRLLDIATNKEHLSDKLVKEKGAAEVWRVARLLLDPSPYRPTAAKILQSFAGLKEKLLPRLL